jgi:hypothetical protein
VPPYSDELDTMLSPWLASVATARNCADCPLLVASPKIPPMIYQKNGLWFAQNAINEQRGYDGDDVLMKNYIAREGVFLIVCNINSANLILK